MVFRARFMDHALAGSCAPGVQAMVNHTAPTEPFAPGTAAAIRTSADDPCGAGFTLEPRGPVPSLGRPVACTVDFPARVGFSVADMTTFAPGKPGGGGIGMAVDLCSHTYAHIAPAPEDADAALSGLTANGAAGDSQPCTVAHGARAAVVRHHVAVFRACLAAVGASPRATSFVASVAHRDAFPARCGLGSTSGAAFGTLVGLNKCFGEPFTLEELRKARCMLTTCLAAATAAPAGRKVAVMCTGGARCRCPGASANWGVRKLFTRSHCASHLNCPTHRCQLL
jgi:hypothetical protein